MTRSAKREGPLNVSLTPELRQLVDSKVASGMYQSASEVIREALRLMKKRDDQAGGGSAKVPERKSSSRRPASD